MVDIKDLKRLWREQKARALKANLWLMKQPIGTKLRLGNALLERIPRSLSATFSDPTEDGYINRYWDDEQWWYTRFKTGTRLHIARDLYVPSPSYQRTYVEWNISSIPVGSTISDVIFKYHGYGRYGEPPSADAHIHEMVGTRPSIQSDDEAGNQAIFDEAGEGTVYADPDGFPLSTINKEQDLGASAISDLQDRLAAAWFAIGMQLDDEVTGGERWVDIWSEEYAAIPAPTLYVEYTLPPKLAKLFEVSLWRVPTTGGETIVEQKSIERTLPRMSTEDLRDALALGVGADQAVVTVAAGQKAVIYGFIIVNNDAANVGDYLLYLGSSATPMYSGKIPKECPVLKTYAHAIEGADGEDIKITIVASTDTDVIIECDVVAV